MEWSTAGAGLGPMAWVVVLGAALAGLALRLHALGLDTGHQERALGEIRAEIRGLRADLAGLARAQQIEELRGRLVADLRPLVEEAVAARGGAPGRASVGIEFAGPATVTGVVSGGGVGHAATGAVTGEAAPPRPRPEPGEHGERAA